MELYDQDRACFQAFLARTTQKEKTISHIKRHITKLSPATAELMANGQQVRMLDIGPGTGHVTIPVMDFMKGNVHCIAQEPSLGMAATLFFNYLVHNLPFENLEIKADGKCEYGKHKFDFVQSSHSFYYLPDWKRSVEQIYYSLKPGGAACILIGSRHSELSQLRERFFPMLHGQHPSCSEDLVSILTQARIPHKIYSIDSVVDFRQELEDPIRHLRLDGVWKPSVESLMSFMLRACYGAFPLELRTDVSKYIGDTLHDHRYMRLCDTAIWLTKPGKTDSRSAQSPVKNDPVTLGDLVEMFHPMFDRYFGKDVPFLKPGLRECYYNVIALDGVLSHPLSKMSLMSKLNSEIVGEDDHPEPIKGRKMKEYTVYEPMADRDRIANWPTYMDSHYLLWHYHNSDGLWYLLKHISQEFGFVSLEDKRGFDRKELQRLMLNIVHKYKPNRIFSSRPDGSTQLGLFLASDLFAPESLVPVSLTPELRDTYSNLGIRLA